MCLHDAWAWIWYAFYGSKLSQVLRVVCAYIAFYSKLANTQGVEQWGGFFMHAWTRMCVWNYICISCSGMCLCSIINGAARNSHHTLLYSPSLQLCVLWTMCTTLQKVSIIEQVLIIALPLSYVITVCVCSKVCIPVYNLLSLAQSLKSSKCDIWTMCQHILPICNNVMYLYVIEHVRVCACKCFNVWWEFSCMDMCLCWYYEWFCYHFPTHHFYSPSLQLCMLWTMCTTLQWVSITAHISTDTFPID